MSNDRYSLKAAVVKEKKNHVASNKKNDAFRLLLSRLQCQHVN